MQRLHLTSLFCCLIFCSAALAQTNQPASTVPPFSLPPAGALVSPSGTPMTSTWQPPPRDSGLPSSTPSTNRLLDVTPSAIDLLPPALQQDERKKQMAPRVTLAATTAAPRGATSVLVVCTVEASDVTETLKAVATPWAERAYVVRADGSESPPLVIEAAEPNAATALEIQVMLQNLRRPLQAGDSFPVTFIFDKSGPQRVMVKVKKQVD